MADRIVVLGANPGHIVTVIDNKLPRPRDYRSAEANAMVDLLHDIITGQAMPDVPLLEAGPTPPEQQEAPPCEALPQTSTSEIVGVLEYLDSRGGRADVFRMAADTNREFGRMIEVVEGAELLNLVDTPKREVVLDEVGRRFLDANAEERKSIWREQLLKLRMFRDVQEMLRAQPDGELDSGDLRDYIVSVLPHEDYQKTFETFVRWARFGNLFAYDERRQRLSLQ